MLLIPASLLAVGAEGAQDLVEVVEPHFAVAREIAGDFLLAPVQQNDVEIGEVHRAIAVGVSGAAPAHLDDAGAGKAVDDQFHHRGRLAEFRAVGVGGVEFGVRENAVRTDDGRVETRVQRRVAEAIRDESLEEFQFEVERDRTIHQTLELP